MIARLVVLLLAGTMAGAAPARATPGPRPLEPGERFEGRTLGDWSAEWWKWAMASPSEVNPVADLSGEHCATGQHGDVWFLAGGFGSSKIRRRCAVPAGRSLFFPAVNMVYWKRPGTEGFPCEAAKRYAAVNNDEALDLFVELDGLPIPDVKRFRAKTETCFNAFERVGANAPNVYPSASDGFWLLLPPLSKGKHILKFGGRYTNGVTDYGRMVQDIEYELLIR